MFTLPRGAFAGRENVRLASAEWARPNEVARFPYQGGGALFVGGIPYEDAWPKLLDLWKKAGELADHIDRRSRSPIERSEDLRILDRIMTAAMKADCLPIGRSDDRHDVTIAGARGYKGLSAIIPNLCLYPGSLVCLDPKGENASLTAVRRGPGNEWCDGLGQVVYVLDPFGVADVPKELRASYNPLAQLDPGSATVVEEASLLAEGIVLPGADGDDHWTDTARALVRGVILHLVSTYEKPTLFDLRRVLTQGEKAAFEAAEEPRKAYLAELARASAAHERYVDEVDPDAVYKEPEWPDDVMPVHVRSATAFLFWRMECNPAFDGIVMGAAESILATGDNERGSILSTARRNTAFLDTLSKTYKDTLSGAFRSLDPGALKSAPRGATVYLCLPAQRMGTHGRWLRLMIGQLLEHVQQQLAPPACGAPVLFLLEEFFALGTMTAIEKAAGYAAGFGVKLWVILQDLQQLKSLYRTSWQTFLANAGMVQVFSVSDAETLEYASKAMGEVELSRVTSSLSVNSNEGTSNSSQLDVVSPALSAGFLKGPLLAGARMALDDTRRSSNTSSSQSYSVGLHTVPLLRPDEIALQFSREGGASLLLLKGERPMWCMRMNYNDCPWLQGLYTPLPEYRDQVRRGAKPWPLWTRKGDAFGPVVDAFNALAAGTHRQGRGRLAG